MGKTLIDLQDECRAQMIGYRHDGATQEDRHAYAQCVGILERTPPPPGTGDELVAILGFIYIIVILSTATRST